MPRPRPSLSIPVHLSFTGEALSRIDRFWRSRGYASRSSFIQSAVVQHLDADGAIAMALAERLGPVIRRDAERRRIEERPPPFPPASTEKGPRLPAPAEETLQTRLAREDLRPRHLRKKGPRRTTPAPAIARRARAQASPAAPAPAPTVPPPLAALHKREDLAAPAHAELRRTDVRRRMEWETG